MDALKQLQPQLDQVAAISVGGQGHGLVLLGKDNVALRPAKLWNDTNRRPTHSGFASCYRLPIGLNEPVPYRGLP